MVIGYLAIFIPVIAVSVYAISQLTLFHRVTGDILHIDHRMRDYEKKIADLLLTQVGYERKFVITKDQELYNQFVLTERDLTNRIAEAEAIADTPNKREVLEHHETAFPHEEKNKGSCQRSF